MANDDRFLTALRELGIVYSKTKKYILNAEQIDPDLKSNISLFKEHRDALDHLMRALWEYFGSDSKGDEEYLCAQIEDARGHMFRAAYDALDGAGISYKFRIRDAMARVSNEAITAVHPDYYRVDLPHLNKIDRKIVEHRQAKDEQRTQTTVSDLDAYIADIEQLYEIANGIIAKTPAFHEWRRKNRRKTTAWIIGFPTFLVVLGSLLKFAGDAYWHSHSRQQSPAHVSPVPTTVTAPAPSAQTTSAPTP